MTKKKTKRKAAKPKTTSVPMLALPSVMQVRVAEFAKEIGAEKLILYAVAPARERKTTFNLSLHNVSPADALGAAEYIRLKICRKMELTLQMAKR